MRGDLDGGPFRPSMLHRPIDEFFAPQSSERRWPPLSFRWSLRRRCRRRLPQLYSSASGALPRFLSSWISTPSRFTAAIGSSSNSVWQLATTKREGLPGGSVLGDDDDLPCCVVQRRWPPPRLRDGRRRRPPRVSVLGGDSGLLRGGDGGLLRGVVLGSDEGFHAVPCLAATAASCAAATAAYSSSLLSALAVGFHREAMCGEPHLG